MSPCIGHSDDGLQASYPNHDFEKIKAQESAGLALKKRLHGPRDSFMVKDCGLDRRPFTASSGCKKM
jgi:hypothetical protein